ALVCLAVIAAASFLVPGVTSADAPDAGPTQETKVTGTVPDLTGRWILVASLGRGGGNRTTTSAWDVTRAEGGLQIHERFVVLPAAQRTQVERGDWTPSARELEAIAADWNGLAPVERGIARARHELVGADAFDDVARRDPIAAGARW